MRAFERSTDAVARGRGVQEYTRARTHTKMHARTRLVVIVVVVVSVVGGGGGGRGGGVTDDNETKTGRRRRRFSDTVFISRFAGVTPIAVTTGPVEKMRYSRT